MTATKPGLVQLSLGSARAVAHSLRFLDGEAGVC